VPIADIGTSVGAPSSALQGDLLHRTSSILISYRHGPLIGAYLSMMCGVTKFRRRPPHGDVGLRVPDHWARSFNRR
jgi:hypothetical protein